ncbi:unnamed protein product [Scytosiphon promiscuus]
MKAGLRVILCSLAVFSSAATSTAPDPGAIVDLRNSTNTMPCWIFSHMNKSGGMTVRKMLIPWLSKHGLKSGRFDDNEWTSGSEFASRFVKRHFPFIYGGYTEGLRPHEGGRCKWFTMFRHPVSRIVSAFFFCKKNRGDQLCANVVADARNMDLLEFAEHWGNYGLRQFALSFLSPEDVMGTGTVSPFCHTSRGRGDVCLPGWYRQKEYLSGSNQGNDCAMFMPEWSSAHFLSAAEQILNTQYAAVGILERWDDSMKLFDEALEISGFSWVDEMKIVGTQNKDERFRSVEDEVLNGAYNDVELKKFIWLDLLLYEHAVAVHEKQMGVLGMV